MRRRHNIHFGFGRRETVSERELLLRHRTNLTSAPLIFPTLNLFPHWLVTCVREEVVLLNTTSGIQARIRGYVRLGCEEH